MYTFNKFLIENDITPFSAFLIARTSMPQIDNISQFIQYVNQFDIEYTEFEISANLIEPTQFDFDQDKVGYFINNPSDKPIVISSDDFVLDGHHRYYAAKQMGRAINVIQFDVTINKLLKLAIEFVES